MQLGTSKNLYGIDLSDCVVKYSDDSRVPNEILLKELDHVKRLFL